jgi:hypothetical protein
MHLPPPFFHQWLTGLSQLFGVLACATFNDRRSLSNANPRSATRLIKRLNTILKQHFGNLKRPLACSSFAAAFGILVAAALPG